jgi:PhoH-like ATPase
MSAVIYLLDTNVLIHDPFALHYFSANQVIIPFYVLEELDFFKAEAAERGKSSRMVARELDMLRTAEANFQQGIALEKGGLLRILKLEQEKLDGKYWDRGLYYDQLILSLALERKHLGENIVVVSKDINLRIRADVLGLKAIDYDPAQSNQNHFLYEKTAIIDIDTDSWQLWLAQGFVDFPKHLIAHIPLNYGVCLLPKGADEELVKSDFRHWGRISSDGTKILALGSANQSYWGLKARNPMQQLALDVMCDPNISLVSLIGKAGTGKTLLALAAGLMQVTEKNLYDKVLSARAIFALGKDIGFLPGTLDEKMAPWIKPVLDNLDFLIYQKQQAQGTNKFLQYSKKSSAQDLIDTGLIEVEPITYLRGRSLPKQFMMIDEAQNLTHHEIKTILTRAGEGTKIILLGDPDQIDHPYLDNVQNGLWYATQKFKGQPIAAAVFLTKGERSGLAELAADLL